MASPVPGVCGVVEEAKVLRSVVGEEEAYGVQLHQQLAAHVPAGQVLCKGWQ